MISTAYALAIIAVCAVVTFLIRALPFLFFRDLQHTPTIILYLGKVLPPAAMLVLVVYSLRATNLLAAPHGLPELIACLAVVLLHLWRRNNLLSILGGTALYMVLIQLVFV